MPNRFVEGVYPEVLERGKGGHVWDADGNEYIDLISGLGAVSVGYANEDINQVVYEQLEQGVSFSLPHRLEYLVAKQLKDLVPSTDQWKFTKTGSDATSMAIKCARAYTGRDNILVCGYHGWHDWYSICNDKKAGIPKVLEQFVTKASYNDLMSFKPIETKQYAAVIMEPMVFDYPAQDFLEMVRHMCNRSGTLLIFDEVVTGGRFEGFVAQNYFKIVPDITVLSKGIANGFPLAALGARKSIMATFERDDFFASTTFGGECVSLAACLETTKQLTKSMSRMIEMGQVIQDSFNELFKGKAACKGYPTRLTFAFPTKEHKAVFMQEMCLAGVLVGYSNMITASYTNDDILEIISAMQQAKSTLIKYWGKPKEALKGEMPVEVFRMR